MKRLWPIALVLVSTSPSGCVYHWAHQVGATDDQGKRDSYVCDREAAALGVSWARCMEAKGYSTSIFPWKARDDAQAAYARRARPVSVPEKTPFERLTEARRQWTRELLTKIDAGECPKLLTCLFDYEATVRRIAADNVGYTFTSADELLFRAVREIGKASDDGTITQDQAVNRLLALDVQIDEIYRSERARQPR